MRFGEFLVKRGWVSEEQLLGALVEQERMPDHEARTLLDSRTVGAADLLRAFDHATDAGVSFKRALHELGLWNEAVDSALKKNHAERRLPIGLVLARRKVLPLLKVVEALETFENERAAVRGIVLESALSSPLDESTTSAGAGEAAAVPALEQPAPGPVRFIPAGLVHEGWKQEFATWSRMHSHARSDLSRELDRWFDRLSRAFIETASRKPAPSPAGYAPFLSILEESLRLVGTFRESLATVDPASVDRVAALLLLSMEQAIVLEEADWDGIGRAHEIVKRIKLQRLSLSLGRQGLGDRLPPSLRDQ